jgi:anti-sigma regulatory factor (Ser/Thr protein kinase)
VESIDPLCASIFSAVRHPSLGWPATTLALCGAGPAVAAVLSGLHVTRRLPVYDSVDEALARARARPPHIEERLALLPTPTSAATARSFVRELCSRWQLDELADVAALLASELVTNAITHAGTPLELRLELREPRLHIAVHDHDPRTVRALSTGEQAEHTRGLLIVDRTARAWGVYPDPDGGKVVWCALNLPADPPADAPAGPSGTSGRR